MKKVLFVVKNTHHYPLEKGYVTVYASDDGFEKRLYPDNNLYNRYGSDECYSDKIELCTFLTLLMHGSIRAAEVLFANESDIKFVDFQFEREVLKRRNELFCAQSLVSNVQETFEYLRSLTAEQAIDNLKKKSNKKSRALSDWNVFGYDRLEYHRLLKMKLVILQWMQSDKLSLNLPEEHAQQCAFLLTRPEDASKMMLDSLLSTYLDMILDARLDHFSYYFCTDTADKIICKLYD